MTASVLAPDGPAALPEAPSLLAVLRAAAGDFYYNSWRLVPANFVWGIGLALLYLVTLVYWPAAVLLAPLLAFPTVGLFRIAALIARDEGVSFGDAMRAWRRYFVPTLVTGVVIVLALLVLLVNVFAGVQSGDLIGWAIATLAGWGLLFVWLWSLCFWPLLTDPRREDWRARSIARAAAYLVVAHPMRLMFLGVILGILLALSTVAFAALIAVSLAYAAVVASRYVLPAADRLDAQLAAAGVSLGP